MDKQKHKHKCSKCGVVWEHDLAKIRREKHTLKKAHTCPKCGTEQYEQYWGPRPATTLTEQSNEQRSQATLNSNHLP
jgi:predicted nucleic-acid-binding Zn-ribbon protein